MFEPRPPGLESSQVFYSPRQKRTRFTEFSPLEDQIAALEALGPTSLSTLDTTATSSGEVEDGTPNVPTVEDKMKNTKALSVTSH